LRDVVFGEVLVEGRRDGEVGFGWRFLGHGRQISQCIRLARMFELALTEKRKLWCCSRAAVSVD
jgi:hypothetical protein